LARTQAMQGVRPSAAAVEAIRACRPKSDLTGQ
jgi:hypothetical protein